MKILAYSYSEGIYSATVGTCPAGTTDIEDILHWLIFSGSTVTTSPLRVVWNLSRFVQSLPLPETVLIALARPPHRVRYGNYRLFYAADKVLSINKNGSEVSFYDLSQYFPDEPEPATITQLQQMADLLADTLSELGVIRPVSLSSPVACFKGHKQLRDMLSAAPTVFDAPEATLDAFEIALQCTPREWLSNYQVGVWRQ